MNTAIALDRDRAIETTTERLSAEFAGRAPATEVRAVVESTFARLEQDARIRTMLAVLTERAARDALQLRAHVEAHDRTAHRITERLSLGRSLAHA